MNKYLKIWHSFRTVEKVANTTSGLAGLTFVMRASYEVLIDLVQ